MIADSREAFVGKGREVCPDVGIHLVNGQDEKVRFNAWSAADILTLPVDNVQETFGIAPVEAMAAGLPVVATDWNGFRDTIVDGETGFLVPTAMGGAGEELAMRYHAGADNYEAYMRGISQSVVMEIGAAANAFAKLATDESLRRRMGEAGRKRALEKYDWAAVIPQYLDLWDEQSRVRTAAPEFAPLSASRAPVYPDPFELFADYPTYAVQETSTEHLAAADASAKVRNPARIPACVGRGSLLPTLPQFDSMLRELVRAPATIADLASCCGGNIPKTTAGVCWLAKYGVVELGSSNRE